MTYKRKNSRCQSTVYVFIFLGILLICLIAWSLYNKVEEHYVNQYDEFLKSIENDFRDFFDNHSHYDHNGSNWMNKIEVLNSIEKSFTINKKEIHICMKDPDGEYYDRHMITYVLAHEIAHTLCDEVGHTDKYYEIFDKLLDEMSKYTLTRYKNHRDPEKRNKKFFYHEKELVDDYCPQFD
jgi:hypothetical protein